MLPRESGFTFRGRHCRDDFGLVFNGPQFPVSPAITRDTYTIAGQSGTVLVGPETVRKTMTITGTLTMAVEPETQAAAQEQLRRIIAWLCAGRGQLIFDYEPDKFYLAEVSAETMWSLKNWFGGELTVSFLCQPYAFSVQETVATADTTGTTATLMLLLDTVERAPVTITVENQGAATITAVDIGGRIRMEGLNLATGQVLTISTDAPIHADVSGVNALPYAQRFEVMRLGAGAHSIPVTLGYAGAGARAAHVEIRARGRW